MFTAVTSVALAIGARPRPVEVYALLHMPSPSHCALALDFSPIPDTKVRFSSVGDAISALKSDVVFAAVCQDPKVAHLSIIKGRLNPIGWLRKHVRVEQLGSTEIVGVYASVGAAHIDDAKVIVNSVARLGIEQSIRLERQRADTASEAREISVLQQASVR